MGPASAGYGDGMTHPQQPELHRSNKGETTQDAQQLRADERDNPTVGGNTGPTPEANQTEDERRSGCPRHSSHFAGRATRDRLENGVKVVPPPAKWGWRDVQVAHRRG